MTVFLQRIEEGSWLTTMLFVGAMLKSWVEAVTELSFYNRTNSLGSVEVWAKPSTFEQAVQMSLLTIRKGLFYLATVRDE